MSLVLFGVQCKQTIWGLKRNKKRIVRSDLRSARFMQHRGLEVG